MNAGKVAAGGIAAALLAVLGVVAVQAEEVSSCWQDFDTLTDNEVFPDAFTVRLAGTYDDKALRAAGTNPAFRAAADFKGDAAIGGPVWTIAAPGPNPVLSDQLGLLAARGGADPDDLAMYEGRNGKRHWMRSAVKPADFFMKNLRALTFVPQSDGTTRVLGADARSGYLQWCAEVPLKPSGAASDQDTGWATGTTGNGRTVLLVGQAKGAAAGTSAIATQDVVTGKVTRQWTVQGTWTDVASDGKLVYAAAPGAVAAFRPGVATPVWRAELPAGAETAFRSVADGRVLVATRPVEGGAGTVTAFDAAGNKAWSVGGSDPEDAIVSGGMLVVRETRGGADGVAAYRLVDGTPAWFTAVPDLKTLADGGTDGTLVYLPGANGPRVLRLADGTAQPTTLTAPVDRILVSGQRIVVQHTASPDLAWTIAYLTPKAQADSGTPAEDPRQR
ncbi:hypothetical protein [Yinghuangia sp. YIM S09857]|uniref:hypothetical protein n=1 Tax=Yinghuangia sp. YIM S09857 TaxID=3436929 RepID=UPI003F539DDF